MTEKKKSEFIQKVILTIIDKLLIAIILVLVGYFIDSRLKALDHKNQMMLEEFRSENAEEASEKKNQSQLYYDAVNKDYNEKWDSKQKEYEKYMLELNRRYQEQREDLLRKDAQLHQERLSEMRTNIALNSDLVKTSLNRIGKVWEEINALNRYSEVFERDALIKNIAVLAELDSMIQVGAKFLFTVSYQKYEPFENRVGSGFPEPNPSSFRQYSDSIIVTQKPGAKGLEVFSRIPFDKPLVEIEKYLVEVFSDAFLEKDEIYKFISELVFIKKSYPVIGWNGTLDLIGEDTQLRYRDLYQKTFGHLITDQTLKIKKVETTINKNWFWIGEKQAQKMIAFLIAQKEFFERIPETSNIYQIEELKQSLNDKRADLFKIRENINFQHLIN